MGERRTSMIERVLHRIEDHMEEWRKHFLTLALGWAIVAFFGLLPLPVGEIANRAAPTHGTPTTGISGTQPGSRTDDASM